MKSLVAALLAVGLLTTPAAAEPKPPKLVVAISVDQLSQQLFNQYLPHFTGGFRRLANGIAFNGYQAHASTETCPGHSTILTGSHPARTGIIENQWVDVDAPREDKTIYCVEDERVPGSTSKAFTVSDFHLRVPTLGDRMKQADRRSRAVTVGGKDRSAAMMAGHDFDQRWWWSKDHFAQNSSATPPPVAAQVNGAIAAALAKPREPLIPPGFCADRDRAVTLAGGVSVGAFRFQRAAGDSKIFSASPELDGATLAMAAALVQQLQLGRGDPTDLLAVSLAATDYVGHTYGTGGVEMCLQLMSLDADLNSFFNFLDSQMIDYAVVLTADHGAQDVPERRRAAGEVDAAWLDEAATPEAVGSEVAKRLGIPGPIFAGEWYLTRAVPAARRNEVIALARQLLLAHPQVHSVFSAAELAAHPLPTGKPESWSIIDRTRASFDAERTAELIVIYKPAVMPITVPAPGRVTTHGSPWDYDRRVPMLFWWKGVPHEQRGETAMTVDILPTLAGLIGLGNLGEIDGHCLDITPGPATNCR